jgi:SAM-dependent methyltransferase
MTGRLPQAVIDGIPSFAPALAHSTEAFDPAAFEALAALEPSNFWFRSRNRLLAWAAKRYFPAARQIHEIGCGTGYVLTALQAAFPDARLSGSEINVEGLVHARRRLPGIELMQMDARDIPFRAEFDLIGAFDVLEHVDDDREVLRQIHAALRPGGGVMLSVPQHRWLWSAQDRRARHHRRYERPALVEMLSTAGFDVIRSTSFVSFLLPAMLLSRRMSDRRPDESGTEALRAPLGLDAPLGAVLGVERWLIRHGVSFPMGGSLLVVANRREDRVGLDV